ncbi:hypothetical protein [Microbacterium sp. gxy059]|uniref:hypothetical protein n=1 Tax=Microbacterium sp. gxy059 TaxID=2957199 RepID=UPI003D979389
MKNTKKWIAPTAAVLLAGGSLVVAPAAYAAGVECAEDLGDRVVEGDLVVPAGATCVLGGAEVSGSVIVEPGGWLDATSAVVGGDLVADDAYGVLVDGTRVGGDVSAYSEGTRSGFLYLQDLEVGGSVAAGGIDVEVSDSSIGGGLLTQQASYVTLLRTSVGADIDLVGSPYGAVVSGAIAAGSLTVTGSSREILIGATADGSPEAWGNTIGGDLVLTDNTGPLRVAGTQVHGAIRTSGNDPAAVLGEGNAAGSVDGEHEGEAPGALPEGDQSIAVTVPEQRAGELIWSLEGTSSLVDLGVAEEDGDRFSAEGEIVPIRVLDTRPGSPAWSLTAQVSDFVAGGETISSRFLGWSPELIENAGDAVAGAAVSSGFSGGDGLSVSRTLVQANEGHARGDSLTGAGLDLQLPLDTPLGTYNATITLTALS